MPSGPLFIQLKKLWEGKRVTIMGLGHYRWGSGSTSARFFSDLGAKVVVTDLQPRRFLSKSIKSLAKYKIKYHLGGHKEQDFTNTDLVVKNPGIKNNAPYLKLASRKDITVTTDISLFFQYCPSPIVGITGTRGKSTTSSLVAHLLKGQTKKVALGGNIGVSPLNFIYQCSPDVPVVIELSSWMLESLGSINKSPNVAVILNILNDHLNHYANITEYKKAKSLITRYQLADDLLIYNYDDKLVKTIINQTAARKVPFSLRKILKEGYYIKNGWIIERFHNKIIKISPLGTSGLLGEHNVANILAATAVARFFGINAKAIRDKLPLFQGIEYRQQKIASYRGVGIYNDTAATSPDASIAALNSLPKPVVLIAGGTDKKLDYAELARKITSNVQWLVLLPGTATKKIVKHINKRGFRNYQETKSMEQAIDSAFGHMMRAKTIVLSPGAASFGLFTNEVDRGEMFNRGIKRKIINMRNAKYSA